MNLNPWLLFKLEWQKFAPNMTIRVMCLLYVVFFALAVLLTFMVGDKVDFSANGQSVRPLDDLLTFPRSWELAAYIGSWLNVMLVGFMGVFMMTVELSNKTLRQNVISGLSRMDVFVAKICALIGISLLGTLCYLLWGGLAGLAMSRGVGLSEMLPPLQVVGGYFCQCLGYGLLGMLLGLFIRQTALASLGYIAYVFFIEGICRWLLYLTVLKHKIVFFLPDKVFESLAPFPVPEMAQQAVEQQEFIEGLSVQQTWIGALVYFGVCAGLIFWRLRRADL